MNLKELKEMINLMNENSLTEIEVEREGTKIKIKKGVEYPESLMRPMEYRVETVPSAGKSSGNHPAVSAASEKSTKDIASPMVGTFYRAPSPESDPFVEIGQVVEVGQVVCIIEAMKLMNEIKSEVRGKVTEVLVDNAEPVEFGQPLFVVEPL